MAFSVIASTSAGSPDTNNVTTPAIDTTGATGLLIAVVSYYSGAPGYTIGDNQGNGAPTDTGITIDDGSSGVQVRLWAYLSPVVGSGHIFTVTSTGMAPALAVLAVSGIKLSSPLDQSATGRHHPTSFQSAQPGSVTPSEADELLVTGVGWSAAVSAVAIDSGFTLAQQVATVGGQHYGLALGDKIQTAAGAESPTWTWTTGSTAATLIATFKAQAASTPQSASDTGRPVLTEASSLVKYPAVTARTESNVTTAGTSHTVSRPAAVAGNLVLILFGYVGSVTTIGWPAGYTPIASFKNQQTGRSWDAASHVDTGVEGTSITVTTTGTSTKSCHVAYSIGGASDPAVQAPEIGTTATGAAGTSADPPSVSGTGGSKSYLAIAAMIQAGEEADDDTWCSSAPSGYTNLLQKTTDTAGATTVNASLATAERLVSAASENPGVFTTAQTTAWIAQTLLIHPLTPPTPKSASDTLRPGLSETAARTPSFTIIASTAAASTDGSTVTTTAINTTGATGILLVATSAHGIGGAADLSDNKSNGTPVDSGVGRSDFYALTHVQVYYYLSPSVGAGHTFTLSHASSFASLHVLAVSGIKLTTPLDQSASATSPAGASAGSLQPGSVTPTEARELLLTSLVLSSVNGDAITIPSGYTGATTPMTGFNYGGASGAKIQPTIGAENPTWSWATSAFYFAAIIATFKPEPIIAATPKTASDTVRPVVTEVSSVKAQGSAAETLVPRLTEASSLVSRSMLTDTTRPIVGETASLMDRSATTETVRPVLSEVASLIVRLSVSESVRPVATEAPAVLFQAEAKLATESVRPVLSEARTLISRTSTSETARPVLSEQVTLRVLGTSDTLRPVVSEATGLAARATPVESLVPGLSEQVSVRGLLSATDLLQPRITSETASLIVSGAISVSGSDTLRPVVSEAPGQRLWKSVAIETLTPLLGEALTLVARSTVTESLTPVVSELAALLRRSTQVDTLTPVISEQSSVFIPVVTIPQAAADTTRPLLGELASLVVHLSTSDLLRPSLAEINVSAVRSSPSDRLGPILGEGLILLGRTVALDTLTPILTDALGSVVAILALRTSDTLMPRLSETPAQLIILAPPPIGLIRLGQVQLTPAGRIPQLTLKPAAKAAVEVTHAALSDPRTDG